MKVHQLRAAERELESAARAITRMKAASSLDEFEDEWRIYLSALEKAWVKTERACLPFKNKFEPWQGKYKKRRKSDPLLKYLYHARHSDQHSVQEMIEPKGAERTATIDGSGGSVYIEHLTTNSYGQISYKGSHPLVVTEYPNRVELIAILSSKKWYQPPRMHMEIKLSWPEPLLVAELGLKYYQQFISDAKILFFSEDVV